MLFYIVGGRWDLAISLGYEAFLVTLPPLALQRRKNQIAKGQEQERLVFLEK